MVTSSGTGQHAAEIEQHCFVHASCCERDTVQGTDKKISLFTGYISACLLSSCASPYTKRKLIGYVLYAVDYTWDRKTDRKQKRELTQCREKPLKFWTIHSSEIKFCFYLTFHVVMDFHWWTSDRLVLSLPVSVTVFLSHGETISLAVDMLSSHGVRCHTVDGLLCVSLCVCAKEILFIPLSQHIGKGLQPLVVIEIHVSLCLSLLRTDR